MIEIKTEYHVSSSDRNDRPAYKCHGTCKKAWWKGDVEQPPFGVQLSCPMCDGLLRPAREGADYTVTKFNPDVKLMTGGTAEVTHLSNLQDEFIPLRKKYGWR